jgi:hypothetical protein
VLLIEPVYFINAGVVVVRVGRRSALSDSRMSIDGFEAQGAPSLRTGLEGRNALSDGVSKKCRDESRHGTL